jgi:hypothetical protein
MCQLQHGLQGMAGSDTKWTKPPAGGWAKLGCSIPRSCDSASADVVAKLKGALILVEGAAHETLGEEEEDDVDSSDDDCVRLPCTCCLATAHTSRPNAAAFQSSLQLVKVMLAACTRLDQRAWVLAQICVAVVLASPCSGTLGSMK